MIAIQRLTARREPPAIIVHTIVPRVPPSPEQVLREFLGAQDPTEPCHRSPISPT
jgi:hypothetical protein